MKKRFNITMMVTPLFKGDTIFQGHLLSFIKVRLDQEHRHKAKAHGYTISLPLSLVRTVTKHGQERYCLYYRSTYDYYSVRFLIKDVIYYYEEKA